jgi:hypothetical protein
MKILSFNNWAILEQEKAKFKVYYLTNRPNHIYRRSGKDSAGNIKWQYQEKNEKDKLNWTNVENKESIKALNLQYQTNLKRVSSNKSTLSKQSSDYWTLIAIIACENYLENKQGMADVAQSIYNRYNIPGKKYGSTISEIILSAGQYEPVKIGGSVWKNISNKESAITAYMKTKGVTREVSIKAIDNAIFAQKDSTLSINSKKHVGSRTEFLANKPISKEAVSPVERKPENQNNCFFWNYAGKTDFYLAKKLSAQSKPSSVNVA